MGIIIRVAFNNKRWAGKCSNADKRDRRLFKCWSKTVETGWRINKRGQCLANCVESVLCRKYYWINFQGNFDAMKASGNAYFVYPDINHSLVLWGKSRIKSVVKNKIFFHPFQPMPEKKWVRGISAKSILGKHWGSTPFRYIDNKIESKLDSLINERDEYFEDPIETIISAQEGKQLLSKHLTKERSTKLVADFKRSLSSLECRVCGFDFEKTYGKVATGFIEAHHIKPISALKGSTEVNIKDMVAVCSNCHRVIHIKKGCIDWRVLKRQIK